jgi:hypothetical protein
MSLPSIKTPIDTCDNSADNQTKGDIQMTKFFVVEDTSGFSVVNYSKVLDLTDALDAGLATLSLVQPAGWREGGFRGVLSWLSPECPTLLGEGAEFF